MREKKPLDPDDHNPAILCHTEKGATRMQRSGGDSIEYKGMSFSCKQIKTLQRWCLSMVRGLNDTVGAETGKVPIVCTRYDFNDFLKGCALVEKKWSVPFKPFIRQMSMLSLR